MVRDKFVASGSSKGRRRLRVLPDQAMSVDEIVRRFVRGIPADVVRRNGVYVDQNERDLEQVARMDFSEKAALADELRVSIAETQAELKKRSEAERAMEAEERLDTRKKSAAEQPEKAHPAKPDDK